MTAIKKRARKRREPSRSSAPAIATAILESLGVMARPTAEDFSRSAKVLGELAENYRHLGQTETADSLTRTADWLRGHALGELVLG